MGNIKGLLTVSLMSFMILAIPQSAAALSTTFSQGIIDWTSLTLSGIDITFIQENSTSIADAGNSTAFDSGQDINTNGGITIAEADVLGAFARAETNNSFVSNFRSASANGVSPTTVASSGASAFRQGSFLALETGE